MEITKPLAPGHGLILRPIETDQYLFGRVTAPLILMEDGQWDEFLPSDEQQRKNGLETQNCTVYGTQNAIEILMARRYWSDQDRGAFDYSERFTGILAGTTPDGNDPHLVAETIREHGLIPENMLPFSESIDTWNEYYSPKPMTSAYVRMGRQWDRVYDFKHEWVMPNELLLRRSLRISPLGVGVYAWEIDPASGEYISLGNPNHWCVIYGYVEGEYWKVFDSYDSTRKKLAWDFPFSPAKVYHINEMPPRGIFGALVDKVEDFLL